MFALRALDAIAHSVQQQFGNKPAVSNQKWQRHIDFEERLWLNIVRLWRRDQALYEPKPTPLLRAYKGDLDMNGSYRGDIEHCVRMTRREDRYRLLRWTLANHHQYKVDIDNLDQLKRKDLEPFSEGLLLSLPHCEAICLFGRCESANQNKHKIKINSLKQLREAGDQALVHLLRLRLLEDSGQVTQEGQERTLHCRQMAEDSGSQPIRSAWINASMYYAVASKSMDTFQDTVIWARRFSRDPKTAMELYGSHPSGGPFFLEENTAMFLSGISIKLSHDTTTSNISQNVRKANQIVLDLLQSAILVQNDPSFKRRHWEKVFLLPRRVIMSRLRHVNALQSRLRLTDDQVFSCVWQDTLDMLIKAEEIGLAEDNEGLEFSQSGGPLAHDYYSRREDPLPRPSVATAHFIDELSSRRDSLWARQRVIREPAVTTFESPWPRGLPVQSLWFLTDNEISGYDQPYYRRNSDWEDKEKKMQACGAHLQHHLPFLEQRVKEVVVLRPENALRPVPTDAETQLAIGSFVDSYPLALKMYLTWCDPAEREKRIQAAWTHATEALRGERMSVLENRHFWKEVFSDAGAKPTASMLDLPSHSDPRLPYQEETIDPVEWNPGPDASLVGVESRSLDALVVDWFRDSRNVTQNSTRVSLRSASVPDFWNMKSYSPNLDEQRRGKIGFYHAEVPRKAREAFVAAALLLVEDRAQAGSKIFGKPFPSTVAPRFPAVFLDTEVLDSKTPSDKDVEMILGRFLPTIPPSLLKALADNLVGKSLEEATPSSNLRKWASVVLRLLVLSDKPELATDMIVRIVLETPGETPWHCILLHPGILKRLPPSHARKVVLDLTNGVVQRLSQQDQDRSAIKSFAEQPTAPGPCTPSKPTVKVTTIRMLAQFLKDASFLGDAFIMDALVSLFQNATHIHVRAAIVDSLASLLCTSRSVKLQEHIVSALETMVVPIAAELNERSPMTEERWRAAEQAGEPPEVYSDANLAPICSALVDAVKFSKHESMRTHNLVQRILLPLIRKSRENNTRWVSIFLRNHNASDLAAQVPGSPAKPQLLELLLTKFTSHMPAVEFANLSELLIFAVDPPKQYAELATRLKEHPHAYKQHGASHWLRTTDATHFIRPRGTQTYQQLTSVLQTSRFATPDQATLHGVITPAQLQAHERKVLGILFANFPFRPEAWKTHTASYKPPLKDKSEDKRLRWQEACSPLLWHAVSLVKNLRKKAWQRDPQRQPAVLPDTFQLRLWLLPYPQLFPPSEHDEKLELFVHDVRACVQRLATKNKPYHERLDLLKGVVVGCPRQDWIALALRFGRLDSGTGRDLTLAECLCVELGDLLLDGMDVASKHDVRCVRDMLDVWTQCFDEGVRGRAHERLGELQDELGLGEATAAEEK